MATGRAFTNYVLESVTNDIKDKSFTLHEILILALFDNLRVIPEHENTALCKDSIFLCSNTHVSFRPKLYASLQLDNYFNKFYSVVFKMILKIIKIKVLTVIFCKKENCGET